MFPHIADKVADGALRPVVVVGHFFESVEQRGRVQISPIGEQHYVVTVVGERLGFQWIDNDGAVQAGLFLKSGMTVIPVGTALAYVEAVVVGLVAVNSIETQA